jgi:hypothetical protein
MEASVMLLQEKSFFEKVTTNLSQRGRLKLDHHRSQLVGGELVLHK